MKELGVLRHEPIDKRIRATLGGADGGGQHAGDARLGAAAGGADVRGAGGGRAGRDRAGARRPAEVPAMGDAPQLAGRRVLDPSVPFAVRSTEGEPLVVRAGGARSGSVPGGRPGSGGLRDRGLRRLRRVVRGGRAQRRPPARPVPPDRHRPRLPARGRGARRRGAGRVLGAVPAVRAADAGPLLPPSGGRADGPAATERHPHASAPTRARRRTCPTARRRTSRGPIRRRCARRPRSPIGSRSSTSAPTSWSTASGSSGRSLPGRRVRAGSPPGRTGRRRGVRAPRGSRRCGRTAAGRARRPR